ncbi:hypothetical protein IWQ60_008782 [Tieghemiomyces parasiticus]|uniref:Uncharacterized protein n=1 Tax=Tieghemiomyces parasiticus TaxID=78921 RepID=A0A9W8DMB9_9FUNG|nr:hypothetical protein IWQ60_008782 [Tieghemiomyces parasiticus]
MPTSPDPLPNLVLVQDAVDQTFYYPVVHYQFADDPDPVYPLPLDDSVTAVELYLGEDGATIEHFRSLASHFQLSGWEYQAGASTRPPLPTRTPAGRNSAVSRSADLNSGSGLAPPSLPSVMGARDDMANFSLSLYNLEAAARTKRPGRTLLLRGMFTEDPAAESSMDDGAHSATRPFTPGNADREDDLAQALAHLEAVAGQLVQRSTAVQKLLDRE